MINEFCGGRHRVFRVSPQHDGTLTVLHDGPFGAGAGSRTPLAAVETATSRWSSLKNRLASSSLGIYAWKVFLPQGYPSSVTEDYARVAFFDVVQILCSSITGTMATRAILEAVGVGRNEASLLSSTLSFLLRDGTTKIASILFASLVSSSLDHRAKSWRFVADICCDLALLLEVLSVVSWQSIMDPLASTLTGMTVATGSPVAVADMFRMAVAVTVIAVLYLVQPVVLVGGVLLWLPRVVLGPLVSAVSSLVPWPAFADRVLLYLLAASVLKAVTGVAGGCSKASITQHFAKKGNIADVSAKNGNRENTASLLGIALGTAAAAVVPTTSADGAKNMLPTLLVFTAFSAMHLYANYHVVASLILTRLNSPRLEICLEAYARLLEYRPTRRGGLEPRIPTPSEMCHLEPLIVLNARVFVCKEPTVALAASASSPLVSRAAKALHLDSSAIQRQWQWLQKAIQPAQLKTPIDFGVSLHSLLLQHPDLAIDQKHQLVLDIEGQLNTPPHHACLVYSHTSRSFSVLLREVYDRHGHPTSVAHVQCNQATTSGTFSADGESRESDGFAATPRGGANGLPLLWAYYHAYFQQRTFIEPASGAATPSLCVVAAEDEGGADSASAGFGEFVRLLRLSGWELDRLLLPDEGWTTVVHYL